MWPQSFKYGLWIHITKLALFKEWLVASEFGWREETVNVDFFFFFNSSDAYEWNRSGLLMCLWDVLGAVSVKPTSHLRSFSFKKLFSGLTPSISLACCRKGVNGEKSNMGECHENEVREWLRGGVPQGREWPRTVLIALESYTQMKGHESRTTASWALVIRPSSFMSWVRHRI